MKSIVVLAVLTGLSVPLTALRGAQEQPPPAEKPDAAPPAAADDTWPSGEPRGYLGVALAPVPEALRSHLGIEEGAMVRELVPGSPADKSGLRLHDVIVSVGGEEVKSPHEAQSRIRAMKPGERVKLGIRRGADSRTVEATLGTATAPQAGEDRPGEKAPEKDADRPGFLGVGFGNVPEGLAFHLNLKDGAGVLVVDVTRGSAAEKAGIETKDILVALDGREIEGPADFSSRMGEKKAGEVAVIDLIHRGEKKKLEVTLAPRPRNRDLPWGRGMPFSDEAPDRFFRQWGPGARSRGKIILRGPDGGEHSFHLPDAFFKAKESAENLFRDLELQFDDLNQTHIPQMKEKLRRQLRELEKQLRDGGGDDWWSSSEHQSVMKAVDGEYEITVKDRNGLRTVTVVKGGKTIVEDQPHDKLDGLPKDVRARVERMVEKLEDVPGDAPRPGFKQKKTLRLELPDQDRLRA